MVREDTNHGADVPPPFLRSTCLPARQDYTFNQLLLMKQSTYLIFPASC
ncbi:MAG: hypothetical protein KAK04_08015 [Cyclobacteriaceae bacterium]|nr:hypothetical protein [Cyclobacteriaceae bacterium]